MAIQVKRYQNNPIITPRGDCWWEKNGTLNPGVIKDNHGLIHILYRAVGFDGHSRFGYATSKDGLNILDRPDLPVYEGDIENPSIRLGIEDPRITYLDNQYYITYTQASVYPVGTPPSIKNEQAPWKVRSSLLTTSDFHTFEDHGQLFKDIDTKDSVLFPEKFGNRYALLHRIWPSIQLTYTTDFKTFEKDINILSPVKGTWESERVGAGAPPIKTDFGWLLFYHANEYFEVEGNKKYYRTGFVILDLKDPSKVLYRHQKPILEPETSYEKTGAVDNIVFLSGAIEMDDSYYLYYGAGDGVIAVGSLDKKELFDLLSGVLDVRH